MEKKLQGQIAIVTGASSGIGAGVSKSLAAAGATVVVNYPVASNKGMADIVVNEGGGGSYHTTVVAGSQSTIMSEQAVGNSSYHTTYVPGVSKYVSRPNYYKTTSLSLLLDAITLKPVKEKIPESTAKQIRNYVSETGSSMKNQFLFHNKQYYGYYDGDAEFYFFQNILI